MNKKAFTLVELLAVITILAIIALIAVPSVIKTINKSREETTILSAQKYVSSVETALTERGIKTAETLTSCTVQSDGNLLCGTETVEVAVKGSAPTSGTLTIEGYVVTKVKNLTFSTGKVSSNDCKTYTYKKLNDDSVETICTAVTESEVGNVPEGNFDVGDEYVCQVNDTQEFHFYVLSKDGDTVSLIMNQNIGYDGVLIPDLSGYTKSEMETKWATDPNSVGTTPWISEADFISAGGTHDEYCSGTTTTVNGTSLCVGSTKYGPVTAFKYLAHATAGWTNIPNIEIDFDNETSELAYSKKLYENLNGEFDVETKNQILTILNGIEYKGIKTTGTSTSIINKDGDAIYTIDNLKARLINGEEATSLLLIDMYSLAQQNNEQIISDDEYSNAIHHAWYTWVTDYSGYYEETDTVVAKNTFKKYILGYWGMSTAVGNSAQDETNAYGITYYLPTGTYSGYYNMGIRPVIELTTDMFE